MTASNRGKQAERLLKSALTKLTQNTDTTFYRLPDAHAGSYAATLCDFLLMHKGKLYLLECKSTKHLFRLPHGNFGVDQVARMRTWGFAGARPYTLIWHEDAEAWRVAPIEYFAARTGGSWDLRDLKTQTLESALTEMLNC